MTDKEIAAKCAELCGLKFSDGGDYIYIDEGGGCTPLFDPASDMYCLKMVVNSIKDRGLEHPFTVLLSLDVMGDKGWRDWRDTWAIISATPRQKCLAAVAALEASKK